jgi:hypothetical protein
MGLLETVKEKLEADGVVNGSTWKCFVGFLPDDQDQCISIHLTGGFPQDTHEGENVLMTFQALVRAGDRAHDVCEAKWWDMFNSLQDADFGASPVGDATVYLCQAMATGPLTFGDEKQRTCMTANFRVVKERPT